MEDEAGSEINILFIMFIIISIQHPLLVLFHILVMLNIQIFIMLCEILLLLYHNIIKKQNKIDFLFYCTIK